MPDAPWSAFDFEGATVPRGAKRKVEIRVARLPTGDWMPIHTEVLNGREPGPTVWLSGAIHGDEIVGTEVVRQVLQGLDPSHLSGRVIAVPVVNVFGFISESRYLPDRRDLNRSFPGSARGSLAGRMAHRFMSAVVDRCDIGIDLHAGSDDRVNLPQIRADLDDSRTRKLAHAFGAPVVIHGPGVRGSVRASATKRGKTVLLYEGGEPRRFNPQAVDAGVAGVLRVLRSLRMIEKAPRRKSMPEESRKTRWIRAGRSGIFRLEAALGHHCRKGDRLGVISDPIGGRGMAVKSTLSGVVVGHTVNPLVNQGDALVHVAEIASG